MSSFRLDRFAWAERVLHQSAWFGCWDVSAANVLGQWGLLLGFILGLKSLPKLWGCEDVLLTEQSRIVLLAWFPAQERVRLHGCPGSLIRVTRWSGLGPYSEVGRARN